MKLWRWERCVSFSKKIIQNSRILLFLLVLNLERILYSLGNSTAEFNTTSNNTINQEAWQNLWDSMEEVDEIIVEFFEIDSLGNLNSTYIFLRIDKSILSTSKPGIFSYNLFLIISIFAISIIILKRRVNFS